MLNACNARAIILAAPFLIAAGIGARAQDNPVFYRDVETKYIFGFTEGSGIGLEGEKEFSLETVARMGKADGRYWASETKLEYEFTPNQYVQFELGPLVSVHNIKNVTDLDDRNQLAMSGIFGEVRYLLLDRGPSSPLAITLSAEPEWHRIDETGGARVKNFGLELKVNADLELIKNRLYLGSNLLYEPEATHDPDGVGAGWEKSRPAACPLPCPIVSCRPYSSARNSGTCVITKEPGSIHLPGMPSTSGLRCTFSSRLRFS